MEKYYCFSDFSVCFIAVNAAADSRWIYFSCRIYRLPFRVRVRDRKYFPPTFLSPSTAKYNYSNYRFFDEITISFYVKEKIFANEWRETIGIVLERREWYTIVPHAFDYYTIAQLLIRRANQMMARWCRKHLQRNEASTSIKVVALQSVHLNIHARDPFVRASSLTLFWTWVFIFRNEPFSHRTAGTTLFRTKVFFRGYFITIHNDRRLATLETYPTIYACDYVRIVDYIDHTRIFTYLWNRVFPKRAMILITARVT